MESGSEGACLVEHVHVPGVTTAFGRRGGRAGRAGGGGGTFTSQRIHPSILPHRIFPTQPARLPAYVGTLSKMGGAEGREGRGPSLACFPKNSGAIARATPATSSPSSCMTGQDRPMQREARALLQWDGSPELAEVDGAPGKPLGDALKRDTSSRV